MSNAALTYDQIDQAARELTRDNSDVSVRSVRHRGVTGGSAQMSDMVREWKAHTRDLLVQTWALPPEFLAGIQNAIHEIKSRTEDAARNAVDATKNKCDELIAMAESRIAEKERRLDDERVGLLTDAELGRRAVGERDALQVKVKNFEQANVQLADENRDLVKDVARQAIELKESTASQELLKHDSAVMQGRLHEMHTQLKSHKSQIKELSRSQANAHSMTDDARGRAAKVQAQLQAKNNRISHLEEIVQQADQKQRDTDQKLTSQCALNVSSMEINKGLRDELKQAEQLISDWKSHRRQWRYLSKPNVIVATFVSQASVRNTDMPGYPAYLKGRADIAVTPTMVWQNFYRRVQMSFRKKALFTGSSSRKLYRLRNA